MATPLFSLQPTSANRSLSSVAVIKWLCLLLVVWAVAGWTRFSGHSNPLVVPPAENEKENDLVPDSTVADVSSYVYELGALQTQVPVAVPGAIQKHLDRVAVIIEDRPLGNLIPILFHFHSVLGPEWPIILYTSLSTETTLLRSAALSRAVASSEIEIRRLPANTTFDTHASVSVFLTSPFLWADLAPYAKVLLFQADSVLCAAAAGRVDDFMDYDLVGAPIDTAFGSGFNGGLSLRNRELLLRVVERWDFAADAAAEDAPVQSRFEDQWFFTKMRALGDDPELADELGVRVNLPDQRTAAGFAVETLWVEGLWPLGFHQPHRWQSGRMDQIMKYCPEVGMIAGSSFFG